MIFYYYYYLMIISSHIAEQDVEHSVEVNFRAGSLHTHCRGPRTETEPVFHPVLAGSTTREVDVIVREMEANF